MNRKLLIAFLYIYALSFSFVKTVRLPNEWSEAHWLMDYRFGFIKRGLAGEIFGFFFEKNILNIQILSAMVLLLLYVAILTISLRQTFQNYSIRKVLFFLVFFLSQYAVLSAHLIGYLDHVIFLLTIIAVVLIRNKKIFLASLVAVFSVVIHEISFFLMVPVCLFALLIDEIPGKSIRFSKDLFKKAGIFLFFPLAATVLISVYQEIWGKENDQLIYHYLEGTGFISRRVALMISSAYTESFGTYLRQQSVYFVDRLFLSKNTFKFGLPILFMLYMVYREFRKIDISVFFLLAVITLFPLLLHAVAWDEFRIWAFPFMILFLGFWVVSSRCQSEQISDARLSWFEIVLFIISVILVAIFQNNLFENEIERLSKIQRCILLVPVFALTVYLYLKKSPNKEILRP